MTTVVRYGDNRLVALVKGAPEWVLEHSTHYQKADGTTAPWTDEAKKAVQEALRTSAVQAMRTLAFGHHVLPEGMPQDEDGLHERREELERGLVFDGFVAIRDPLREDVKDAIAECRNAGIEVKMITGDNVQTARAIGYNIGLINNPEAPINGEDGLILTSDRFNELTDEQLKQRLPNLRILARARPLDKFRMVKALQELGEVVAVTGDGTNDAPALKKADVGLAMGIAGTEVAKEASKIVLLDDAFSTIVKAVQWGRSLYENIQRFLQFQLTINVSALTIAFLGPLFFGVKAPFTVLQLLWINVIMDTFAAIALCSEPPRPGVMKVPPKRRDENILTQPMIRTIFITAAFFVLVMMGTLVLMKGAPNAPGLLAGEGTWWFKTDGEAVAVAPEYLKKTDDGKWQVTGAPADTEAARLNGQVGTAVFDGPWSFEASGTREAVSGKYLEPADNRNWKVTNASGELDKLNNQVGDAAFTVLQVSLFFSIYVFFQVWNQINCRSLTPRESGFHKILENPTFITIASIVAIGQIVIVTIGGTVFKVQPLPLPYWLGVIAFTSTVLIFAEVSRRIRVAAESRQAQAPAFPPPTVPRG
jgi:Ca2+-transporting ATPase